GVAHGDGDALRRAVRDVRGHERGDEPFEVDVAVERVGLSVDERGRCGCGHGDHLGAVGAAVGTARRLPDAGSSPGPGTVPGTVPGRVKRSVRVAARAVATSGGRPSPVRPATTASAVSGASRTPLRPWPVATCRPGT